MRIHRPGIGRLELVVFLAHLSTVFLVMVTFGCQRVRTTDHRNWTRNQLRQVGVALHNCNDTFKRMPPAFGKMAIIKDDCTWSIHLLPFVEQDPLYKKFVNGSGDNFAMVPAYLSPEDPSPQNGKSVANFAVNLRVFTTDGYKTGVESNTLQDATIISGEGMANVPRSFLDGTSNVIMLSTRYAHDKSRFPSEMVGCSAYANSYVSEGPGPFFGRLIAQSKADNSGRDDVTFQLAPAMEKVKCTGAAPQAFTAAGLYVCMGDVSIRHVSPGISVPTWNQAITPNDGQVLGGDWDN